MNKLLTNKEYWEIYYRQSSTNREQIERVCGYYDEFWDQMVASCTHQPKSIIEIGAYPGRFIAYIAARYGLEATALDYNSDRTKIEESFDTMNVNNYEIIQADFLEYVPKKKYDLVISNGFIEHFENYNEVLNHHCEYIAPGGALLIMIPNKRYMRKWFDYLCDYKNLKIHNLNCMRLSKFRKFASMNKLEITTLEYTGGFNYNVHQKLNLPQRVIHQSFRQFFIRLNPILEKYPNKYFSSTIVGIFKKH